MRGGTSIAPTHGLTGQRRMEVPMASIFVRKSLLVGLVAAAVLVVGCGPAAQQAAEKPAEKAAEKPAAQGAEKPRYEGVPFPTVGTPKSGGILRIMQTDDPPNFDLYSNSTYAMQNFTWAAYNNLVIFDPYNPTKI